MILANFQKFQLQKCPDVSFFNLAGWFWALNVGNNYIPTKWVVCLRNVTFLILSGIGNFLLGIIETAQKFHKTKNNFPVPPHGECSPKLQKAIILL